MSTHTPPALFNLPIMCNVDNTLSIYNATGLNFMNEEKTRIIVAWIHPEETGYYFIWYVDERSGKHWLAFQDSRGTTLSVAVHHPLDHWKSFIETTRLSDSSVRQGTMAIGRAFVTYNTFNPRNNQYATST